VKSPSPGRATDLLLLVAAVVVYGVLAYGDALRLPFLQDDWTILEKVMRVPPAGLIAPTELLYGWYRPWSRELHFAVLHGVFGMSPSGYHVVSLALWIAVLAVYAAYVRRLAGGATAAFATLGLLAVGAWSGTLLWVSGAQELWLLLFTLLALQAFASGRTMLATLAGLGALASKETAAVLPVLAFLHAWRIDRATIGAALRRVAPLLVVTAAWLALHPGLRARLGAPGEAEIHPAISLSRSMLACFNFERVPNPENGWGLGLLVGLAGALVIAVAAWWLTRKSVAPADPPARIGAHELGLGWFAIGLVPASLAVSWSPYYALLAACGAWLALGALLSVRRSLAIAVLAIVALLQPVQARTPAWEWGGQAFQRRAARYVEPLRLALIRDHPAVPPHTRFYFADVPQGVGVGHDWFTPAFRVWYGDTTLHAGFLSSYQPRNDGGTDLFYRFDPPERWIELIVGPEDLARAMEMNGTWAEDHKRLALTFGRARDWERAAVEIEKLATAYPDNPEYPRNLARCLEEKGDSARASQWKARADSLEAASTASSPP